MARTSRSRRQRSTLLRRMPPAAAARGADRQARQRRQRSRLRTPWPRGTARAIPLLARSAAGHLGGFPAGCAESFVEQQTRFCGVYLAKRGGASSYTLALKEPLAYPTARPKRGSRSLLAQASGSGQRTVFQGFPNIGCSELLQHWVEIHVHTGCIAVALAARNDRSGAPGHDGRGINQRANQRAIAAAIAILNPQPMGGAVVQADRAR